jgi:hypothetical protein
MSPSRYIATLWNPGKLPRRWLYSCSFHHPGIQKLATLSAFAYGNGSRMIGRAIPNTAAVPPMPSASVRTASSVYAGRVRRRRAA